MIELTAQGGEPLALNPDAVWHVRPANGDQTAVYAASGAVLFVSQGYAEVLSLLREHRSSQHDAR